MINRKVEILDKRVKYNCELRIDGKTIEKIETDDYEVWYDKITDRVYELTEFMKIDIIIKICNS
ncbi:MAG: hypothetical protein ACFFCM_12420 [Promethearchaeota archaeon]